MKESKTLELKEIVSNTFLKTVSAYANFNTGKIVFGIKDSGEIVGIEKPETACLDIENKINDSIKPKPDFTLNIDKKTGVITLLVKEGMFKPYLYKGKAYRRSDTSTVEVDQIELKRLILLGENLYFEELPIDDEDLSFNYLFKELEEKLSIKDCTKDVLKTLGLISNDNKYNNAAALLSDKNKFPGIDIIKFGATINDILYRSTISNVSVLEQLNDAEKVFRNYYLVEEIKGMKREKKFLIPLEAFRETVANALVHRTWDVISNIRIAMYDDRIEVYSPGGLPAGLSKEEYLNGFISTLRNPIIANVFFRLGIIEKFGTGILRIKESYREITHKPIFEVQENSVITILPSVTKRPILTVDEQEVLNHLSSGMILASSELSTYTGFGKDKVVNLLNNLIEKQYVEKLGAGRGTKYKSI
ncbi:MAG: AAA family ATPase [Christensenellaceae bacterium]|nr:AAA family ATPase [Christensenellaceae bacterium]